MGEDESKDVYRVVAESPELGVGEAVHDEEDGRGDVANHGGPEDRNSPILASGNNDVQITAELVALVDVRQLIDCAGASNTF